MVAKKKSKCTPPKSIKRNEHGLIQDVDYIFNEDGFIDWRSMLKDKWLYPNPSKKLNTTEVSKLQDRDLCILLGGIKELAQIRGFTNVKYSLHSPSPDYVVASCEISWIPNY